ncbi:alcohol dehydrogenase catalytic domain-containing protein [Escherichia coli]
MHPRGSDLHLDRGKIPQVKHGDIFGHEFMGEVVETGKDLKKFAKRRPGGYFVCHCLWRLFFVECSNMPPAKVPMRVKALRSIKDRPAPAASFGHSHLHRGVPGGQAEYVRVPKGKCGAV